MISWINEVGFLVAWGAWSLLLLISMFKWFSAQEAYDEDSDAREAKWGTAFFVFLACFIILMWLAPWIWRS
jgi:hypothetical protein